jgi:hypothetical protein
MGNRAIMKCRLPLVLLVALAPLPTLPSEFGLTLDDRIHAQEAIERVYEEHRIGGRRSFEDRVPRAVVEEKVYRYLKRSEALTRYWGVSADAQALRDEARRIVSRSRAPRRLIELFDALGNDPVLIQECLVRPVLIDRLIRRQFESDPSFPEWISFDEWWGGIRHTLSGQPVSPPAGLSEGFVEAALDDLHSRRPTAPGGVDMFWDNQSLDDLDTGAPDIWSGDPGVWTGSELIVWGGGSGDESNPVPGVGGRYDPALDLWAPTTTQGAPEKRTDHTAVWTGEEMIVWGGVIFHVDGGCQLSGQATGGRYDPVLDQWTAVSSAGAPPTYDHTAVWTGEEMIVWGGTSEIGRASCRERV